MGQHFTMFGPDEASVYDLSCLTLMSINSRKGNLFYVGRIRLVTGQTFKGAKPLDSIQFSPDVSVNSSCTQRYPRSTVGHLPALLVPVLEHWHYY